MALGVLGLFSVLPEEAHPQDLLGHMPSTEVKGVISMKHIRRPDQPKAPMDGDLVQPPSVTKEEFCRFCRFLYDRHFVSASGGNLSARAGEEIFVTPSGGSFRDMEPEIVVTLDEEGRVMGGGTPTKDVDVHLGILRLRPNIRVVCHVHGPYLIAVSAILDPGPDVLPPLTPGFVYFVHPLPMIPFMVPGTRSLTDAAIAPFRNPRCSALLLQNHGLITLGRDFQEAINLAEEVDEVARIYLLTEGRARPIPAGEIGRIKDLDQELRKGRRPEDTGCRP